MTDAGFALRIAYSQLLAGLVYAGKPVKVYDLMAPNGAVAPYIILGPWTAQRDNTKDTFGQSGEINLDIVTRFSGDVRSTRPAAEIAALVTALLKPDTIAEVLNVAGFQCWNTVVVGSTDIVAPTGTDMIFRKVVTISHSLWQQ